MATSVPDVLQKSRSGYFAAKISALDHLINMAGDGEELRALEILRFQSDVDPQSPTRKAQVKSPT
jgi:hypothetical protein